MAACISDLSRWIRSHRVQLNTARIKAPCCTSVCVCSTLSQTLQSVCSDVVMPSKYVHGLGIHTDCDTSMKSRVARTVIRRFAVLRQIRNIICSESQPVLLYILSRTTPSSQSLSLHSHLSLADAHLLEYHPNMTNRCLAVTGDGSVAECGRLSQPSCFLCALS